MIASLLADVSVAQLLVRMATTAFIVIATAYAVGRLGSGIGGVLAGMPIVLGPGFFFLSRQFPAEFVAEAAIYSVISLCSTQLFLLTYVFGAKRARPMVVLAMAIMAWIIAASVLRHTPPSLTLGLVFFVLMSVFTQWVSRRYAEAGARPSGSARFGDLLLRGAFAGVLVAGVTLGAEFLDATLAGMLLAYPIGYTVLSVTIHERYGPQMAAATMRAALLGTASQAGFCGALALLILIWAPLPAFFAALLVGLLVTMLLLMRSHWIGVSATANR